MNHQRCQNQKENFWVGKSGKTKKWSKLEKILDQKN